MYTRLYPRNITNAARVIVSAGTALIIFRSGKIRSFQISDETKLISYCQAQGILVDDQRVLRRTERVETGANHSDDRPRYFLSEKARNSLDRVVQKFQKGDLAPISHAVRLQLDPEAPARKWTLSNRVLAFAQTGELDCRGYKQWRDAGRQVKRGTRSAYILRPRLIKKTNDDGEEEQRLIGFTPVAVFPVEATEGYPLPSYKPTDMPPLPHQLLARGW
jgi:hypothetical protein